MAATDQRIEIRVPDIGDFKDVQVIELCARPGEDVLAEQALITLESDKATIDVPTPQAGRLHDYAVKVGDKVSAGSLIAWIEVPVQASADAPDTGAATAAAMDAPGSPAVAGTSADFAGMTCDMLVLGGGPGGYSAAFRSADLGMKTVLVERYPTLGGVCLNVGCIPSKALLHVAAVMDEAAHLGACGVTFTPPAVDLAALRAHKNAIVDKLTGGLSAMARGRKVTVVQGTGRFVDAQHLEVTGSDGERTRIRFARAIIAAGSQPVRLPFMPEDPRVVDSTGALALQKVPKTLLVIGGGVIGLEMATIYSALGSRITVVELGHDLMPGADRDLVSVWEKENAHRFDAVLRDTGVVTARATAEGIAVTYSNQQSGVFDQVLVAVGRVPNGKSLGAENAGVAVDARGFIPVDAQRRTNVAHIFAIGDIVGPPMLAHKAVHEGHVAAEAAGGSRRVFDPLQIPSVAYTQPEIAWTGKTETQCIAEGRPYRKGLFPWAASGRAIANGCDEGVTKLLFDEETQRVIGGGVVGAQAGDLIGEICLAVEMGCDATDLGRTIHPHPTLGEIIGMAADAGEGVCTDLPAARKK